MRKKTNEEYIKELSIKNPNVKVLEEYSGANIPIKHMCACGNDEWYVAPSQVLTGISCKKCSIKRKTKTNEDYINEVKLLNGNIEVIEKYQGARTPIMHKCKICEYGSNGEWRIAPTEILCGTGCPICAGSKIGPHPEYKNSIWASKYRELAEYYGMTEEQMKTVMPKSNKKIKILCPDCGKSKLISPNQLFTIGICCPQCSDGVSYPEKFMMSVLDQLDIDYVYQYSPNWANGKIYDFYLLNYNTIIETHGIQHYERPHQSRCLIEEQENDIYKNKVANENNIAHYFVIDCRYSNLDWIKSHIISSELLTLFNICDSSIDWHLCDKAAISSKIIIAADLWNDGKSVGEICEIMKLSKDTIRHYLIKAVNIGVCDYNRDESRKRGRQSEICRKKLSESRKRMVGKNSPNAKQIVQFDKEFNVISIWYSAMCAENETGVDHSRIAACCRLKVKSAGGYIWRYVYDQTDKKNNNVIYGAPTLNLISPSALLTIQN